MIYVLASVTPPLSHLWRKKYSLTNSLMIVLPFLFDRHPSSNSTSFKMPFLIFAFVEESLLIHSSIDKNPNACPKNSRDCFYHLSLLLRCYYSTPFRNQNVSHPLSLPQKIFLRYLGCACPFLLPDVQNSCKTQEGDEKGDPMATQFPEIYF